MPSKSLANTKTPNPNNPSSLPPRFEIRKLELKDLDYASAIVCHSNGFHSTVWPKLYTSSPMWERVRSMFAAADYICRHQIESGMSYGVFDTEYVYRNPSSAATGGKLYWKSASELDPESVEETQSLAKEGERVLAQMDFPLVSVALSYDASQPLDHEKMGPLTQTLPHFGLVYQILGEKDPRRKEDWEAKGPGEVLMRNATSTRRDYEGLGIMGGLARWLQREAAEKGYRGIQIECLADAVTHVWSDGADERFKGHVVSEFECEEWRDENGKLAFSPVKQRVTKCWVDLKPGESKTPRLFESHPPRRQ